MLESSNNELLFIVSMPHTRVSYRQDIMTQGTKPTNNLWRHISIDVDVRHPG